MDLCRTRMPILKTVSNVHFKIKKNSEKPGPAVSHDLKLCFLPPDASPMISPGGYEVAPYDERRRYERNPV